MDLRLVSDPLSQDDKLAVVTVDEVKRAARITSSAWDADIKDDIEAAYDYLAGPTGWLGGCCLLNEEWEAYLPSPMGSRFELPLRPLSGAVIDGFDRLDAATGDYVEVEAGGYALFIPSGSFATIARTASPWPYVAPGQPLGYRLRFVAGFGTEREDVPSPIRKAIRLLAAHWADARSATSADGRAVGQQIEFGVRALCGRYRISPDHS